MNILNKPDYKLMEQLVKYDEKELSMFLYNFLKRHYDEVVKTDIYMYAKGTIPVALAAHMDTVFPKPPTELFYDTQKNVMWAPGGTGFDDRAGVYAIVKIISAGYRPNIIFTSGEEIGGVGSEALSKIPCPFEDLKYIIQLDRRGTNDCVFYDCDNPDFVHYIEGFGFTEAWGSFTDICWLCPEWGIAGVNLSIGYVREHTASETLYVQPMLATIEKVKRILRSKDFPRFEYIPMKWNYLSGNNYYFSEDSQECDICHYLCLSDYMVDVELANGKMGKMCLDCAEKHAAVCKSCNNLFEKNIKDPDATLCYKCKHTKKK